MARKRTKAVPTRSPWQTEVNAILTEAWTVDGWPGSRVRALSKMLDAATSAASTRTVEPDFRTPIILLHALGAREAHAAGIARFGGVDPGDSNSPISRRRRGRLIGRDPDKLNPDLVERPDFDELLANATTLAIGSSQLLLEAADAFLRGDQQVAISLRRKVIEDWNTFVDRRRVNAFPFERLCDHCGRPLTLVADQRLGNSRLAPPLVHPECRNAFKRAQRRSETRRAKGK